MATAAPGASASPLFDLSETHRTLFAKAEHFARRELYPPVASRDRLPVEPDEKLLETLTDESNYRSSVILDGRSFSSSAHAPVTARNSR